MLRLPRMLGMQCVQAMDQGGLQDADACAAFTS